MEHGRRLYHSGALDVAGAALYGPATGGVPADVPAGAARIEHTARSSTLVERKLIGGIVLLWRDQADELLADAAAQTQFVRVKLRPWVEVYAELDGLCPWLEARGALYRCWQPGRTTVTFVVSQPDALATRAVELAVERKPESYILIACDLAASASKPARPRPLAAATSAPSCVRRWQRS